MGIPEDLGKFIWFLRMGHTSTAWSDNKNNSHDLKRCNVCKPLRTGTSRANFESEHLYWSTCTEFHVILRL